MLTYTDQSLLCYHHKQWMAGTQIMVKMIVFICYVNPRLRIHNSP